MEPLWIGKIPVGIFEYDVVINSSEVSARVLWKNVFGNDRNDGLVVMHSGELRTMRDLYSRLLGELYDDIDTIKKHMSELDEVFKKTRTFRQED